MNKPAAARRPQALRRATSDRRMLQVAMRLIAENGPTAVSMASIGLAAGYSRGLPAERFGSRLLLLEAVVDASESWFERHVEHRLEGRRGCAAISLRISEHIRLTRESEAAIAMFMLIKEAASPSSELRPRIGRLTDVYCAAFLTHLKEARQLGELREGLDLNRHARSLVSAMYGMITLALVEEDLSGLEALERHITSVHLAAMMRKAPEVL